MSFNAMSSELLNNPMVNSRLASSAIFTEQNSLNNGASQETSPQNHSTDGVNNPLVNPMLASSVIFTDQDSFRNDVVERSTPTLAVLLADATK